MIDSSNAISDGACGTHQDDSQLKSTTSVDVVKGTCLGFPSEASDPQPEGDSRRGEHRPDEAAAREIREKAAPAFPLHAGPMPS